MGRRRRKSKVIEQAEARATGLKSKDANFDLGNGLTAAAYEERIAKTRAALDEYNESLAISDRLLNELTAEERALREYSGRILAATKGKYGPNSTEYELAGGTRTEEREPPKPTKPKPKS
ncbi:MAG TPA: hypothetical protein VF546_03985 [Pyrinomonadaceae bacterium]|jgi:hypothetical protein